MEDVMKSNFNGASTDGTAAMDVDGVMFLVKRQEDVDAMKTTSYGSSFMLEIGCCGRRWDEGSGMEVRMVAECGME